MSGNTATLSVRTDKELKEQVGIILKNLGLNHSTAINMFYRLVIANNGIPFDVKITNKETLKALENSRNGNGLTAYKDSKDLFDDLEI